MGLRNPLSEILSQMGVEPPETYDQLDKTLNQWFTSKDLSYFKYSLRHGKLTIYADPVTAKMLLTHTDDLLDHLFIYNTGTVEEIKVLSKHTIKETSARDTL